MIKEGENVSEAEKIRIERQKQVEDEIRAEILGITVGELREKVEDQKYVENLLKEKMFNQIEDQKQSIQRQAERLVRLGNANINGSRNNMMQHLDDTFGIVQNDLGYNNNERYYNDKCSIYNEDYSQMRFSNVIPQSLALKSSIAHVNQTNPIHHTSEIHKNLQTSSIYLNSLEYLHNSSVHHNNNQIKSITSDYNNNIINSNMNSNMNNSNKQLHDSIIMRQLLMRQSKNLSDDVNDNIRKNNKINVDNDVAQVYSEQVRQEGLIEKRLRILKQYQQINHKNSSNHNPINSYYEYKNNKYYNNNISLQQQQNQPQLHYNYQNYHKYTLNNNNSFTQSQPITKLLSRVQNNLKLNEKNNILLHRRQKQIQKLPIYKEKQVKMSVEDEMRFNDSVRKIRKIDEIYGGNKSGNNKEKEKSGIMDERKIYPGKQRGRYNDNDKKNVNVVIENDNNDDNYINNIPKFVYPNSPRPYPIPSPRHRIKTSPRHINSAQLQLLKQKSLTKPRGSLFYHRESQHKQIQTQYNKLKHPIIRENNFDRKRGYKQENMDKSNRKYEYYYYK